MGFSVSIERSFGLSRPSPALPPRNHRSTTQGQQPIQRHEALDSQDINQVMRSVFDALAAGPPPTPRRLRSPFGRRNPHENANDGGNADGILLFAAIARMAELLRRMEDYGSQVPTSPGIVKSITRHPLTAKLAGALTSPQHTPDTSSCTICCRTFQEIIMGESILVDENMRAASRSESTCELPDVLLFPCQHAFCSTCAERWLQQSDMCPNCRQSITEMLKESAAAGAATIEAKSAAVAGEDASQVLSMSSITPDGHSSTPPSSTVPQWWLDAIRDDPLEAEGCSVGVAETPRQQLRSDDETSMQGQEVPVKREEEVEVEDDCRSMESVCSAAFFAPSAHAQYGSSQAPMRTRPGTRHLSAERRPLQANANTGEVAQLRRLSTRPQYIGLGEPRRPNSNAAGQPEDGLEDDTLSS
ncbi:hypothetical protein ABL78_6364 [Leptomonas seymouri]|uniref:RING-type domain-containing protein n=1 Tax=Leptomonas seymouri TaxID=5684 RepID=A0A0N1HVH5_LEPSE|nr:hypothetical protein ABL78_6364 [Leptomonas seymouri]|eukprot:KPI84574.1 hypothetical protein ABL78_6364 [Leptomonas seymouri]